jgi:oxygen-independent coproporphyrinogen-3 oxidase
MDFIYAIPGQSLEDWRSDLCRAVAAGVQHISTYELTVEEDARLSGGKLPPVDEELSVAMWEEAAEATSPAGFRRYEVSNLAWPGYECRHNSEIWHGGTYLGVGPAASSFDGDVRRTNRADLEAWLNGAAPEEDRLPPAARAAEILALGLRTTKGWTREEFRSRTGFDYLELRGEVLTELAREGLLEVHGSDAIRPTARGLLFADRVGRCLLG